MTRYALQHRTEQGRTTYFGRIAGNNVRLVVGYDIAADKYRFHVYVTRGNGQEEKIDIADPTAGTEEEARDAAIGFAEHVA